MKTLLIKVPDKWNGKPCAAGFADCNKCPLLAQVKWLSQNKKAECPLSTANEAVAVDKLECRGEFDISGLKNVKGVKFYAVITEENE